MFILNRSQGNYSRTSTPAKQPNTEIDFDNQYDNETVDCFDEGESSCNLNQSSRSTSAAKKIKQNEDSEITEIIGLIKKNVKMILRHRQQIILTVFRCLLNLI